MDESGPVIEEMKGAIISRYGYAAAEREPVSPAIIRAFSACLPTAMLVPAEDSQTLAEAVGDALYALDRNAQALGIRLVQIRPGYARMTLKVRPEMSNSHNICHGGIIFTLADTAFAYACNSRNHNTVASGCAIDFVSPAHPGETLGAVAEERALAGRTGVYDVEVHGEDGRIIALMRGKSYRIKGEVVSAAASLVEGGAGVA
jgi:acyl-CoA thioesterase